MSFGLSLKRVFMADKTSNWQAKLDAARREIAYYKRLSIENGIIRLRETETLSELINELKKTHKALEDSETRYQSIFENTGTGMLIVDEDMTISFVNAEFENLTGYKRQEVEGKIKWTEFVDKSDRSYG